MTTGWELSRKMMPACRAAMATLPVGLFGDIADAPIERDLHEATDLVMKRQAGDIAVRVRGYDAHRLHRGVRRGYLDFDWSVRHRANGYTTEIHKLRQGFGRWYFFAVANDDESTLYDWAFIDLDAVRACGIMDDSAAWEIHENGDGTAGGYLPMRLLRELGCIVAHGRPVESLDRGYTPRMRDLPLFEYREELQAIARRHKWTYEGDNQ